MDRAHVRYIVHDVDLAIEFYCTELGFEVKARPAPGFAALERGALTLLLSAPGVGGGGAGLPQPGGWNRIQIAIDDLASFHQALRARGAAFRSEIIEGRGGAQVLLEDPSGNPIELFQPEHARPQAIPSEYHSVTPFFAVDDVEVFIDFVERAFGARVAHRMRSDDGVTRHATVMIGDSSLMLSSGTQLYGARPSTLHIYLEDVDAAYERALAAGAESIEAPHDEFYGDRRAGVADAWQNHWWLATHVEDVDPRSLRSREAQFRRERESAGPRAS